MADEDAPKVIVMTGPTASGKTALAVELALRLGGEVINADSMQVYRGMDIGTAKPGREEMRGIPHHLLDVVEPDEPFNAALFRSLALPAVRDVVGRGKVCFVVGGTGLYIRALLGGLMACPPSDPALREVLIAEWNSGGLERLYKTLQRVDPESAAAIHPHDGVRVTRALEIFELTGEKASALSRAHAFRDTHLKPLKIGLWVPRPELYERIDIRSRTMMESGLVEETQRLLNRGFSPALKPMQAIGYRHAVGFLEGRWSLEEAIRLLQRDTRRYAKRQATWFRTDSRMQWVRPAEVDAVADSVRSFLSRRADESGGSTDGLRVSSRAS